MKMIRHLIFFLMVCYTSSITAQSGWNWPEEGTDKYSKAQEKQAYYKIQMQLEKHDAALNALNYLYENTPDLNESIYIDGAKVVDKLLDNCAETGRQERLEDSLLWMFDMRIKYFDNDAAAIDRKAYTAFKLYYKTPPKYAMLRELYEEVYKLDAANISNFNLTPYMTLANYYHKVKPDEMTAENVLDIHQTITDVINTKINNGGNEQRLRKEQDKIDAFLSSLGDILTCDFIKVKLVPKFRKNPDNLNMAKKIFSYSLKAKCTNESYFVDAGETLFKSDPSFGLAKALGDKAYSADNYEKALKYYAKAIELGAAGDEKYEAYMGKASTLDKLNDKPKARSMAYEALNERPGASEAYNFIGNLYFTSYEMCKNGESKVKDRAVYLAAYEMYQKAGNSDQMNASKEQFPGIEDIFNENYEEGQKITVNCWINESVVIKRR